MIKQLLFLTSLLVISVFILAVPKAVQAGCTVPALCDAPPGECSLTCNGNQPCSINNGWVTTCETKCSCSNTFLPCDVKGGPCGGSGSDPYNVNGGQYGVCGGEGGALCQVNCAVSTTQCFETIQEEGCCSGGGGNNSPTPIPSPSPSGSNTPAPSGGGGGSPTPSGGGGGGASPTPSASPSPAPGCNIDGQCTGFEDCENCPGDCGFCIVGTNQPWWQASTGHVFAGNTNGTAIQSQIFSTFCLAPDCIALLITPNSTGNAESEGIAITGGGSINTNGFTNTTDTEVVGSRGTRFTENYGFFYRNSNLGLNPVGDFAGQENDIQKPTTTKDAYFHQGNLTLQTPWTVPSGESYTIFIDGNLTISDLSNINQLTDVAEGGFLAFIVSGDILIEESVGNENLTSTTANLEGIFVADGAITIESRGPVNGDERFVGEGSFISWTQVNLDRNLSGDSGSGNENQGVPAETFIFRPDFIKNVPAILTKPHSIWQESN